MALAVQLPDAASLQRTQAVVENVEKFLREEPAVVNIVALVGLDILSGRASATNGATIFVNLKDWDDRPAKDQLDAIAGRVNGKLFGMRDATAFAFNLPEVPGLGATAGVEINLQNRSGMDIRDFAQRVQDFRAATAQLPASAGLNSSFRSSVPQVFVTVNREAAKSRGVNLADLFGTMQTFLSDLYINDFNLFGKTYRVQAEAQQAFRQKPEDIGRLYVRGTGGAMIPLSALTTQTYRSAPTVLQRFNGFTSAQFTGAHRNRDAVRVNCSTKSIVSCSRSSRRRESAFRVLGPVVSGARIERRCRTGVRARLDHRLPRACRTVRELVGVAFAVLLGVPFGVLGALLAIWIRAQPNDVKFQDGMKAVV